MCKEFFTFHAQRRRKNWGGTQIFFMKTKIINLDFPCFQFFSCFSSYIFFHHTELGDSFFSPVLFSTIFPAIFYTHYPWTTQPTNISRERVGMSHPYRSWNETEKLFRDWLKKTWSCATWHTCHMVTWSHGRVRDILVTGFRMNNAFPVYDEVKENKAGWNSSYRNCLSFTVIELSVDW